MILIPIRWATPPDSAGNGPVPVAWVLVGHATSAAAGGAPLYLYLAAD